MDIKYSGISGITETERSSIENCVGMIASTPHGSAPFARDMGIKKYPPEEGSDLEKSRYAMEVITQCEAWESRVKVKQVVFEANNRTRMVLEYDKR